MAKYTGESRTVDAYAIVKIGETSAQATRLQLDNGTEVTASSILMQRERPQPGDYWVIEVDGMVSIGKKDNFERRFKLYLHEL